MIATLLDESERIINKWGNRDKSPENYIFPILTDGLSNRRAHEIIQTHLQTVNKFNKRLAEKLTLGVNLTTIVATHSFTFVMIENGVDLAILKDLMGHSSITTTEIYVKPFNSKTPQKKKSFAFFKKKIHKPRRRQQQKKISQAGFLPKKKLHNRLKRVRNKF